MNQLLFVAPLIFGVLMMLAGRWGWGWVTKRSADLAEAGRRLEERRVPVLSRVLAPHTVLIYRFTCIAWIIVGAGTALVGLLGLAGVFPSEPGGVAGDHTDSISSLILGAVMILLGAFQIVDNVRTRSTLPVTPDQSDGPELDALFSKFGKYVPIVLAPAAVVFGLLLVATNLGAL